MEENGKDLLLVPEKAIYFYFGRKTCLSKNSGYKQIVYLVNYF